MYNSINMYKFGGNHCQNSKQIVRHTDRWLLQSRIGSVGHQFALAVIQWDISAEPNGFASAVQCRSPLGPRIERKSNFRRIDSVTMNMKFSFKNVRDRRRRHHFINFGHGSVTNLGRWKMSPAAQLNTIMKINQRNAACLCIVKPRYVPGPLQRNAEKPQSLFILRRLSQQVLMET